MLTCSFQTELKEQDVSKIVKPDIETSGIEARFYDQLVFIGTFGLYHRLLKRVVEAMDIRPGDHILDMGAGTGKNALLMHPNLDKGSITALEIGRVMQRKFRRKCGGIRNIYLENLHIEEPLPYRDRFDKAFISYVLHGFEHEQRRSIIQNAYQALKQNGRLFIFDWNEFNLSESGPVMRFFMNHIECRPAREFIQQDLQKLLSRTGFRDMHSNLYFRNRIRLLSCIK